MEPYTLYPIEPLRERLKESLKKKPIWAHGPLGNYQEALLRAGIERSRDKGTLRFGFRGLGLVWGVRVGISGLGLGGGEGSYQNHGCTSEYRNPTFCLV